MICFGESAGRPRSRVHGSLFFLANQSTVTGTSASSATPNGIGGVIARQDLEAEIDQRRRGLVGAAVPRRREDRLDVRVQQLADQRSTLGDVGQLLVVAAARPELVLAAVGLVVDVAEAVLMQVHQTGRGAVAQRRWPARRRARRESRPGRCARRARLATIEQIPQQLVLPPGVVVAEEERHRRRARRRARRERDRASRSYGDLRRRRGRAQLGDDPGRCLRDRRDPARPSPASSTQQRSRPRPDGRHRDPPGRKQRNTPRSSSRSARWRCSSSPPSANGTTTAGTSGTQDVHRRVVPALADGDRRASHLGAQVGQVAHGLEPVESRRLLLQPRPHRLGGERTGEHGGGQPGCVVPPAMGVDDDLEQRAADHAATGRDQHALQPIRGGDLDRRRAVGDEARCSGSARSSASPDGTCPRAGRTADRSARGSRRSSGWPTCAARSSWRAWCSRRPTRMSRTLHTTRGRSTPIEWTASSSGSNSNSNFLRPNGNSSINTTAGCGDGELVEDHPRSLAHRRLHRPRRIVADEVEVRVVAERRQVDDPHAVRAWWCRPGSVHRSAGRRRSVRPSASASDSERTRCPRPSACWQ